MAKIPHASEYYRSTNNANRTHHNQRQQHNRNYQARHNNGDDSSVIPWIVGGSLAAWVISAHPLIALTVGAVYWLNSD